MGRGSRRRAAFMPLQRGALGASANALRCADGAAAGTPRASAPRRAADVLAPATSPGGETLELAPGAAQFLATLISTRLHRLCENTPGRRTLIGATELRQTVAHGVSRGLPGGRRRAAERRQKREQTAGQTGVSAAPPGLTRLCALAPRLTPWATLCRCSAAWLRRLTKTS